MIWHRCVGWISAARFAGNSSSLFLSTKRIVAVGSSPARQRLNAWLTFSLQSGQEAVTTSPASPCSGRCIVQSSASHDDAPGVSSLSRIHRTRTATRLWVNRVYLVDLGVGSGPAQSNHDCIGGRRAIMVARARRARGMCTTNSTGFELSLEDPWTKV